MWQLSSHIITHILQTASTTATASAPVHKLFRKWMQLLSKVGPTHHRSPAIPQTFTNHHEMTIRGRESQANRSTATGQTTATTTTDTAPLKRGVGAKGTARTVEPQRLTKGRATRRGPAKMTHTITTIRTTITTGGTAPQRGAELEVLRTP